MAFMLVNEFPNIDYQMCYQLLEDKGWNYPAVQADLNKIKQQEQEREEKQGESIMQVMQACPDITDFDMIRKQLIANNWSV